MTFISVVIAFLVIVIVIGVCIALAMQSDALSVYDKEQAAQRAVIVAHYTKVEAAKLAREQVDAEAVQ